jgi:large subunit ribosomal protein L24
MRKIKKGDEVIVITGKDKGKRGKVLHMLGERVLVEGVNLVKKAVKPNPNAGDKGGITEKEAALNISNVALYNPKTKKADKVIIRRSDDGQNVRHFKSNNELVEI